MVTQQHKVYETSVKADLRGKFIAIQAYSKKKQDKFQTSNQPWHLKELEKYQYTSPQLVEGGK